ncbi:MAG: hypothetical protein QOJ96_1628 [Alphaproteobacteria bacterium]|jgi:hypothetical protein|nr:hypothetical protein [Alphaproteobacteria bacterium]
MAIQRTLPKVPNNMVSQVVADFQSEGFIVQVTDNGDGTSKVIATRP